MGGTDSDQQYRLKWNNHHSTILSLFDSLLEEESLVDVTLSADGQFLRAHRIILSACSPYFRSLFRSSFLHDKAPVIVLKDVDFENLKSLVDYMYKGEANVPQHMLPSFIKTAESLQIRGLAEGASKQYDSTTTSNNRDARSSSSPINPAAAAVAVAAASGGMSSVLPPPHLFPSLAAAAVATSTPLPMHHSRHKNNSNSNGNKHFGSNETTNNANGSGGILAARLAKFNTDAAAAAAATNLFEFNPEVFATLAARNNHSSPSHLQPKKTRKDRKLKPPALRGTQAHGSPVVSQSYNSNSNFTGDMSDDCVLKIDEDSESCRESNSMVLPPKNINNNDDLANLEVSNGMESDEEPAMPGPPPHLAAASGVTNPWTGEDMSNVINEDTDENSAHGGDGPVFPSVNTSGSFDASHSRDRDGMTEIDMSCSSSAGIVNIGSSSQPRDPNTNKFTCTRCGRSYLHQATLVRHQRYECGISASYPCSLCGRKFKRRDVLKGHMEKCVNKTAAAAAAAQQQDQASPYHPGLSS